MYLLVYQNFINKICIQLSQVVKMYYYNNGKQPFSMFQVFIHVIHAELVNNWDMRVFHFNHTRNRR